MSREIAELGRRDTAAIRVPLSHVTECAAIVRIIDEVRERG